MEHNGATVRWTTAMNKLIFSHQSLQNLPNIFHSFCASKEFVTGSSFNGQMNALGMNGFGIYTFPHGVIYKGAFENGAFHGPGELHYPKGQIIDCLFLRGNLISYKYKFADGLEYKEPWDYCKKPNRNFHVEHNGLNPAPIEYRTNFQPTRELKKPYYDTCGGLFNEVNQTIALVKEGEDVDQKNIQYETPDKKEIKQILKHCRKYGDDAIGYRKDLYEIWMNGRQEQIEKMSKKFKSRIQ